MNWTFAVIEVRTDSVSKKICNRFGNYSAARDFADSMNNFCGSLPVVFKVRKLQLGNNFKPLDVVIW